MFGKINAFSRTPDGLKLIQICSILHVLATHDININCMMTEGFKETNLGLANQYFKYGIQYIVEHVGNSGMLCNRLVERCEEHARHS